MEKAGSKSTGTDHFDDTRFLVGSTEFTSALNVVVQHHKDNYEKQIIEVGMRYVVFMVEHPEHLKHIVMMDHHSAIIIKEGIFAEPERYIVSMLQTLFERFGNERNIEEGFWAMDALSVWRLVPSCW